MGKKTTSRKRQAKKEPVHAQRRSMNSALIAVAIVFVTAAITFLLIYINMPGPTVIPLPSKTIRPAPDANSEQSSNHETRYVTAGKLTMVWDTIKPDIRQRVKPTANHSNIARSDFVGAQNCAQCHKANFADWSTHPHRWMNALAEESTVHGDFSENSQLAYHGGVARFYREGQTFRMRFDRGDFHRVYEISQTIGSRFYQYYVGKGIEGPEAPSHDFYHMDHVLPFGYWLQRKTWVPIVHVSEELPDDQRWDSLESLRPKFHSKDSNDVGLSRGVFDSNAELSLVYANSCNSCHTTFPIADMFVRMPSRMGDLIPARSLLELGKYVAAEHPKIFDGTKPAEEVPSEFLKEMTGTFIAFDARDKAASLGITCEACHLGCKHHSENPNEKPAFVPQSPHLLMFDDPKNVATGRNHDNLNAICARCHVGQRPTYAGGMATWNSTEYTDATRGSCYSKLTCVECHDPHKATGPQWTKTADQDDASCLRCHQGFSEPATRQKHTHHSAGSSGDRCMNCHMPHINEGIQEVVRTHTIFSPTNTAMLRANQPNACNLCHLDKTIDWTLDKLKSWYSLALPENEIAASYPMRKEPVGISWLNSQHQATRLVTAAAFARQDAKWGLPAMITMLDDPYMINRQFAQTSVERLIGKPLDQSIGYWFHQQPAERKSAIEKLRKMISSESN